MEIGRLAAIWRYPIKSLAGEPLTHVRIEPGGIPGDRASALFVRSGHARAGKTYRGKEHQRLHLTADAGDARAMAAQRGVDLERSDGEHFFDAAPVSLLIDCWMDGLNEAAGYRVEPERFRPNLFVRAEPGFGRLETELAGTRLRLGRVELVVRDPIVRCVTITYHPHRDDPDPAILQYVARHRDACMGVYCDVVVPGEIATGDRLTG